MPGKGIKIRLSKRSKAPRPPMKKTEQDMNSNGQAATRNGSSSSNDTKTNTRCLRVHMPNGKIVQATVDAKLSSSDLLVMMAGKNKLNPVSHMMKVPSSNPLEESVLLKPSQCVGDINGDIVFLLAKPQKEQYTIKNNKKEPAKFEKTIRLTVNYGTKHKIVLRINPERTLADLLPQICDEKGVDSNHHTLRLPKTPSDELDLNKSLASYDTNELILVDTRAPSRQDSSSMPELVGDKKKKSFFGKLKKKKTGFDLEQTPSVNTAKSGSISPTSPTRQRPSSVSVPMKNSGSLSPTSTRQRPDTVFSERAPPLKANAEITRSQTTRKRAAPKPPTAVKSVDDAAIVSSKPVSRKKKAPAPPRPDVSLQSLDGSPKSLEKEDAPNSPVEPSSPDVDTTNSNVTMDETIEVEVHIKPTEEEINQKNLTGRSFERPLSLPPPPPSDDEHSVGSSLHSDAEDGAVDVSELIDAESGRHLKCTCNQETGEHECIVHRGMTRGQAIARIGGVGLAQAVPRVEEESPQVEEINTPPPDEADSSKEAEDTGENVDGNEVCKDENKELEDAVIEAIEKATKDENDEDIDKEESDKNKVEVKIEEEVRNEKEEEVKKDEDFQKSKDVYIETVDISDKITDSKVISNVEISTEKEEDSPDKIQKEEISTDTSTVVNGDVSKVTNDETIIQKPNVTDNEVKDLKDKYELLQQQFATLQQQMISSQQNMLEQHKAQAGAPVVTAQELFALQAQQMQQLMQQQMLLQSQSLIKVPQTIPEGQQPPEKPVAPETTKKEETKPTTPQDIQLPKTSPPKPEVPKKVQSPEADKDLASAFRSLKPKAKPTKHSYIFSAAMRPRSESDAAKSASSAGYETKKRSDSNPEPQKTSEPVKPLQTNTETINESNSGKLSPKEAIVHPNVVIIEKNPDNPKGENGVLSGRSSTIPQATVAPQPASKPSGRIISYRNPRSEELQDIQTSGSVSKFRQMFAGNNT